MSQANSLFDKREKANSLRKEKKFNEAVVIYAELWACEPETRNEWDGWGYVASLRKLNRGAEAEAIARESLKAFPDFQLTRNELGWCLYERHIKMSDEEIAANEQEFLKAAVEITTLTKQEKYSPYAKTVLKTVDYLKSRPNSHSQDRLAWLDRLDPGELALDTFSFADENGKQRVLASERERYFANLTDALHELGNWERCIEACDQALAAIPEFHYDNDTWIKRRRALCQANIGQTEEAIAALKEILAKHKAFFIQQDIAELLRQTGKPEEALLFAAQAALDRSDAQMKLKVYETLARIFEAIGQHELARDHYLLIAAIRQERGWRISDDLVAHLAGTNIGLSREEYSELNARLERAWQQAVDAGRSRVSGMIKVIRERNGFITAEDKRDYFFRLNDFRGPKTLLTEGQPVTFVVEEGFDKKKNQPALNAVDVRPRKA